MRTGEAIQPMLRRSVLRALDMVAPEMLRKGVGMHPWGTNDLSYVLTT